MSADQSVAISVEADGGKGGGETNKERRLARKAEKQAKRKAETEGLSAETGSGAVGAQADGGDENGPGEEEEGEEEEVEAVSHKEMRKRRRAEKQATKGGAGVGEGVTSSGPPVHPSRAAAVAAATTTSNAHIRSRHSIWVGNLSFRTTPERLQDWFGEKGVFGISRVNMPKGAKKMEHNKGFAYVDVPSADAVQSCIDLSESHLDGRKLLIKSGSDYSGRPEIDRTAVALASGSNAGTVDSSVARVGDSSHQAAGEVSQKGKTGLTKTAQKILRAQKHPPGPTLFFGNLSFNSTEDGLREMVERSAAARDEWSSQKGKKEKRRGGGKGRGKGDSSEEDGDDSGSDSEQGSSEDESDGEESDEAKGKGDRESKQRQKKSEGLRGAGIRKVRLGQFEDTGKCKGFAFIDFFSPAYATASLIDPRNGRLDGRELLLQYAGADAVRRGAPKGQVNGPRPVRDNRRAPKRLHNDAFEDEQKQEVLGPAPVPGSFDPDAPVLKKHKETKEERMKRREGQQGHDGRRAKPGAALANAQRGKTGIDLDAPLAVKKTFD